MDDEHHKYLQMQDEMSRFEAEISGGEPLPLQPPRCIIGAGTYGAMQSRLEGGFEGARLAFEAPPLLVPSAVARRAAPPLALFGAFAAPEPPPPRAQPVVLSSAPQLYDKSQQEENERRKEMESNNFPQPLVVPKPAKEFEQPEPVPYYNSHQKDTDSQSSGKSNKKEKKNRKLIRTAGGQVWEDTTLNDWPDDDYRLFCGDLGNDVTDELLIRTFGKYSSFQRAKVVRDKRTNKSKGFGFVSFKDPSDFIKAMKEMNGRYVGSRPIKLRKSTWRNRSLDVVRKKEKEKAALIAMFTGGKKNN